ncbi:radical SAM protein [Candidatus Borrarchaeum sp.]|uniref:radical SAM protein n=1 Tax=Candidatus Borrarchaeum sp. TaxID=2846742 RepID=UPI00257E3D03|nr:radical SAM protein [Candidatus Borrarchaeum sp.]
MSQAKMILNSSSSELKKYMENAFNLRRKNFGNLLWNYAPNIVHYEIESFKQESPNAFVPISITGTACALNCDHCQSKILESMKPARSPDELVQLCEELSKKGSKGVLISGGANKHGFVPLLKYTNALKVIKERFGLKVVVHTGLIDKETAKILADSHIDAAMLDVIASQDTIETVYHINATPEKYEESIRLLKEFNIPIVPHVVVGLNYGTLDGEINALEMLSKYDPDAIVIVALMPLEGTPMENVTPPSPETIAKIITIARLTFQDKPVMLGCARPKGYHKEETDILAIRAGINGIAYITDAGVEEAQSLDLKIIHKELCCSLIISDILT